MFNLNELTMLFSEFDMSMDKQITYLGYLVLQFLIGAFLLLMIPTYSLETTSSKLWKAYPQSAYIWLTLLSISYAGIISFLNIGQQPVPIGYLMTGLLIAQFSNRHLSSLLQQLLKVILYTQIAFNLIEQPLFALFTALTVYFLVESGLSLYVNQPRLRINTIHPDREDLMLNIARLLNVFVIIFLVTHVVLFFSDLEFESPFYLLYGLIPFSYFLYKKLKHPYLGYLSVGLFAYANSFGALLLIPFGKPYGLNLIHTLSVAAVLSIACYLIVTSTVAGKEVER
jgi:hypothetical protein